jgi:hypothetical protein
MTTVRKKLSLGNVVARSEEREGANRTRAWTVSPARAEQLKRRARRGGEGDQGRAAAALREAANREGGMSAKRPLPPTRHAELVSASNAPHAPTGRDEKWTLKRVQGDGLGSASKAQKLPRMKLEISVG